MQNKIYLFINLTVSLFLVSCGGGGTDSAVQDPPLQQDTTPPAISIVGDAVVYHEQGTTYTDEGATATDDVDGVVSVSVSGSVGNAAGTYTITYIATDAAGNSASVSRQVIVRDTTPPQITLLGTNLLVVEQGKTFIDPGATATDRVDGTVTVSVTGTVDTSTPADYILVYSASDIAGNSSEVTRTVRVEEVTNTDEIRVLDQGLAANDWDSGLNAFDEELNYNQCNNDGGLACPNINWSIVDDAERGNVLEIEHTDAGKLAGFFVKSSVPVDLREYDDGALLFDLKTISGDGLYTMKLDCIYPCTSGNQDIKFVVEETWTEIVIPLAVLKEAGLNLSKVDTGIVIWARNYSGNVFRLDNVRFAKSFTGESSISDINEPPPASYNLRNFGAGSVSDTINPASYLCVYDYGNWIYNAGIVEPGIADCNTSTNKPTGTPTQLYPQVSGDAANEPVATHRWWGSVSFLGEMTLGNPNDAAYITPDPITARISNAGFRMMGIPSALSVKGIDYGYTIPDPFAEVFDGIAIANSQHTNMQAFANKTSDASITVQWQADGEEVMTATFVHGSPYVFIEVSQGELVLKTLREDGGEKGIYHQDSESLGIWTSVAGSTNYYLVSGDGETQFTDTSSNNIGISNPVKSYTVSWLPANGSTPDTDMINVFKQYARNIIATVSIDYAVEPATNNVLVTTSYLDMSANPVETLAGLQPLHWKNVTSNLAYTGYQSRSARGITKFVKQTGYSYSLPYVGVLPTLPTFTDQLDIGKLTQLVNEFINIDESQWNTYRDTYWSGKIYGKVSELLAIADAIGMEQAKQQLLNWLKAELEDWFNAETDGKLDTYKYFVYDDRWNTLLGMDESFAAHQQLNDHHFHYGYFVRAAAEVCRHEPDWCSSTNYGPMVRLLIRDYAGGRNDDMFPYLRHFDPANGFSWASGTVNFVRGNNNESTSEASNAYGAMILFGLITNDEEIINRGIYLHASTSQSYWQYWNNVDRYLGAGADDDNFPDNYNYLTTSIIWGDGAVFSTWFSPAYAHILGIQGLPTNTLNLHIGIYSAYLSEYITLGMTESSNGKPSGLLPDHWRDIWWNIWALTDADASISDYVTVQDYDPEVGESKAHTYHWLHTFKSLGQMLMGTGELTADYPAAMAFSKDGLVSYVVFNYGTSIRQVTFSNGVEIQALPGQFTIVQQ